MYNIAIAPKANDTARIITRLRAQIDRWLTALCAERQATVGAELALPYSLDTAPACGQDARSDAMPSLDVQGVEQLLQRPRLPRPIGRHLSAERDAGLDLRARRVERLAQGLRPRLPRPIGRRLIAALDAALDLRAQSAERLAPAQRPRLPRPIGRRLSAEQLPYEPQGTALLSVEVGAA